MDVYFPTIRRLFRLLDCVAASYETVVKCARGRQDVDWMVSGLLCLWVLLQIGVLAHYLRIYPLF